MEPLLHRSVNSAFPGLISFWTAFLSRNRSVWTSRRRLFFDAVWNEIGSYAPDEVVIVGDSLTSDIRGGKNAGILTCWYNRIIFRTKLKLHRTVPSTIFRISFRIWMKAGDLLMRTRVLQEKKLCGADAEWCGAAPPLMQKNFTGKGRAVIRFMFFVTAHSAREVLL